MFLVVEPKFEWDAGAVKRRDRAVKHARITAAELFRTSPLDESPAGSAEGSARFFSFFFISATAVRSQSAAAGAGCTVRVLLLLLFCVFRLPEALVGRSPCACDGVWGVCNQIHKV